MVKNKKLTQKQIAKNNRMLILNLIRKKGVATKHDLYSTLELSHTTINTYVSELTKENLVEEAGFGESIGGRRPVTLQIAKDSGYFFGIYLAPSKSKIILVNLIGEELAREDVIYKKSIPFDDVLDKIFDSSREMLRTNKIKIKQVKGAGMAFPGVVNSKELYVEYAPNIGLRNYNLKDFEKKLGIKLYVENEAVAGLLSEQFSGDIKGSRNVVYVSVAEGIGTAVLIDGRVYKSNNGRAGEFGHVNVVPDGLKCNCGRHGCWELYASTTALKRYSKTNIDNTGATKEVETNIKNDEESAIEEYTKYLFKGLESILLAVSPDEVVIGGEVGLKMNEIIDLGINKLHLNHNFYGYENTIIRATSSKENPAYAGSYLIAFSEVYGSSL